MKHETKSLTIKDMNDEGRGLAKIATLSAIDHDGDTYVAGAFGWKEGGHQWVSMLPAHNRTAMPFGKARVYEDGDAAYAELHLNLNSEAGREWHASLKFDLAKGEAVQEWSYGFGVLDAGYEQRGEERIRVLKRLDVNEVSPVLRGAGVGTGTLSLKSRGSFGGQIDAVIAELEDIVERAGDVKALREADGRPMSAGRLEQLAALKQRLEALLTGDEDGAAKAAAEELERLAGAFSTRAARRRIGR